MNFRGVASEVQGLRGAMQNMPDRTSPEATGFRMVAEALDVLASAVAQIAPLVSAASTTTNAGAPDYDGALTATDVVNGIYALPFNSRITAIYVNGVKQLTPSQFQQQATQIQFIAPWIPQSTDSVTAQLWR